MRFIHRKMRIHAVDRFILHDDSAVVITPQPTEEFTQTDMVVLHAAVYPCDRLIRLTHTLNQFTTTADISQLLIRNQVCFEAFITHYHASFQQGDHCLLVLLIGRDIELRSRHYHFDPIGKDCELMRLVFCNLKIALTLQVHLAANRTEGSVIRQLRTLIEYHLRAIRKHIGHRTICSRNRRHRLR